MTKSEQMPIDTRFADRLTGIADIIERRAATDGERTALICETRTTSFSELNRRADAVAAALAGDGVGIGARVAYCAQASETYYECLYGTAKNRSVFVPLNWRLGPREIAAILQDSEAELLFLGPDYIGWEAVLRAACPALRRIVTLSGCGSADPAYEAWLARAEAGSSHTRPQTQTQDDVVQLYTSGTTGAPKGVVLTNASYSAVVQQGIDAGWVDWQRDDRVLVCMPLFHVGGVNVGLIAAARGACAVISARVDVATVLDHFERHAITIAFLAPAVIAAVSRAAGTRLGALASVRAVFYGTSPISSTVLAEAQAVFDASFNQVYGLTETCGSITHLSPQAHRSGGEKLRSCGKPIAGTEIAILGPNGAPAAAGSPGEIVVRGPTLMKGYWKRPQETAAAWEGGWFHTGDIGYFDDQGYLYIHDRLKDMIVSGGENIYPAEVENILAGHPAVAEVAVIGVPDPRWGEAVKAVIVLRAGLTADQTDIIAFARKQIAGYKLPKTVDFVNTLPRNATGKILRRAVRASYWSGEARLVS